MSSQRPLPPNVAEALRRGNTLEAIKLLREATRVGLAEAKSAVDQHQASAAKAKPRPSMGAAHSRPVPYRQGGLSPGEVPRSSMGGAGAVVFLIAAAGVLAWLYSKLG